ncbi:MAG: Gfo/Idh/MocA family oxidoreductase [Dysgonamonadaceae bacterium]|jgi:predicted dehydrogenase|nr:Gfo/Idh/MocA family oxidoreductase [Dysgonamonadaceae bacterium]
MNNSRYCNWGIFGPGRIARKFAEGLKSLPDARLYAVSSRSEKRAEAFRREFGFEKAYGSYDQMLADPLLDVVYIATTNNLHFEHTIMCLEAGKAVLCEKPFALNCAQVEQMIALAQRKKVFLMEALCSRFMPSMLALKSQIDGDIIGKPVMLQCDFGFVSPFDPQNRVYSPELGGGSVPDIGIYPVFTALYLFGYPVEIHVASIPCPTGTDWTTAVIFKHTDGEISMLSSSFQALLNNEARVYGEKGCLKLHRLFSKTDRLSFIDNQDRQTLLTSEMTGNGYNYEAAEVMRCLNLGLTESPAMSHRFSMDLILLIDIITKKAFK